MNRYDIAIVGMGCIFPKANSVDDYWKNIVSGETYFEEMPERIWRMRNFYSSDKSRPDKTYTMTGAFVSDFEFPFLEFKLPPNAMKGVDPAQLVTLHAAKQALEDAGIEPHSRALDDAVTIIGASGVDQFAHSTVFLRRHMYLKHLRPQLEQAGVSEERLAELDDQFAKKLNEYGHVWNPSVAAIGAITSSLSNRVAQVLGVRGYNMTVDGACASSFAALDVACQALMAGDARVALAGGTDLGTNPAIYIGFSRVEGLSTKGMSNPFDQSADGLVIGEGGGIVVLKRLEDALADGDRIRAVIRGAGASSDGAGQAIYAPSVEGRALALRSALERSGTAADEVQFLEAHATSTVVGDANEYDAISSVYGGDRSPDNPLYLGSVKHQIGHLKAAAGIAGLIKTVLAMENETVPHMPRFKTLTNRATMSSEALVVNKDLVPWKPNPDGKRVAAITSSGFGGVNFHFILEQGDEYEAPAARPQVPRDIAVVGVTCRVAGADSPDQFWENIKEGVDVFSDVDADELRWEDHLDTGPANERIITKKVARLPDYKFNLLRHKIFPKSMDQIAPTQFLGVDLADRLLEGAGYELQERKNVGVSVGAMHDDYFPEIFMPMALDEYAAAIRDCEVAQAVDGDVLEKALAKVHEELKREFPPVTEHTLPGWMTNVIAGRMANKLNLQGPNFTVDSACSSGVGAFLPAMYQLMFGTVDMMISGGLNQQLSDTFTSGVCSIDAMAEKVARPFDAAGKGFLVGEGGILYLLKRLEDAERDGDDILAIIHAVGGSSEADSKSMLAPTEEAVRRGIRTTLERTDVRADEIGVVDCHGSANLLSDLVEARSLAAELRDGSDAPPVHLTAIKSHVGHLYGGAGASSLFSTIQALRHRTVPGIRNLDRPRPEIEDILDKARPRHGTEPLESDFTAGAVNSLGLGGANYFLVVSTPKSRAEAKDTEPKPEPTSTESAVTNTTAGGSPAMSVSRPMMRAGDQSSADIFVCLAEGESELESALGRALKHSPIPQFISEGSAPSTRLAVTYTNEDELKSKLGNAMRMVQGGHSLRPLESQGVFAETVTPEASPEPLVYCFPGQGTHYIGMGRFLYDSHEGFRETVDAVHELAMKAFDFDLRGHIYADPQDKAVAERLGTLVGAQTALFAVEVGMARVMETLGVRPDAAVGHSFGEISALTVAGVWDLPTAYRVVEARIRSADVVLQGDGPRLGMMSVICSDEQRDAILGLSEGKVVLTNINAPGRFILAGELDWVKRTVAVAESFGAEARLLPIGAAFHSRFMEPAREPFRKALSGLPCAQPAFPILSTITGEYIKPGSVSSDWLAEHLSGQLVTKLNLPREIGRLYGEGHRHFLEVGPGWSLTKMIAAILGDKPYRAAPVLHPKVGDEETFRRARAFLVALGHMGSAAERQNLPRLFSDDFVAYLEEREPAVLALLEEVHSRYLDITRQEAHRMFAPPTGPRPGEERALKSTTPARPAVEISPAPKAPPAPATAEPAPAPAAAGADTGVWVERVREKLVTTTGYPAEMLEDDLDLEADLGVDSVQRAEIWISLTEEHGLDKEARPTGIRTIANFAEALAKLDATGSLEGPAPQAQAAPEPAPAPAAPAAAGADTGVWVERVREKLVTTTGYPAEMLEDDLDLEADLGVDSVQRAEIWISLTEEHGLDKEARPTGIRTIANFAEALAELDATGSLEGPAPQAQAAPAPAPEKPAPAAEAPAAQPAAAGADTGVWVERVREKLVTTTGYPAEMLEDDLDLEADLGVDSVQRAEIWISLTEEHGLDKEARPTGIRTIANFAEALAELDGGAGTKAQAQSDETASQTDRSGEQARQTAPSDTWGLFATSTAAVTSSDLEAFNCRRVVVVASRRDRWTAGLANRLSKHGVETEVLEAASVDNTFPEALAKLIGGCDTIIYAAHKEVLEPKQTGREALAVLRDETDRIYNVFKKLFGILEKDPKRIIVPVSQDGAFGALGGVSDKLLGSFPAGFVKSLARELPDCKVQLVDTGDMGWSEAMDQVIDKSAGFVELGLTSFGPIRPVLAQVQNTGDADLPLEKDDLVLVTGGARGIVFECVAALAERTGCRLLLTGRTLLPEGKPAWLDAQPSQIDDEIRKLEIELVKSQKMPLGEAKKEGAKARSQWELNRNLARLEEAGVQARYEVCDVSNPDELGALLRTVAEKDTIKGVVHGAGVQRSKLLPELSEEAVSRTMDTKTTPMLAMVDNLDWSRVRVLAGFGSITGVFGNPGQTDYAMANDLLAWMVGSLGAKHPGLKAQTIDWTAWSGTGMVTDEEAKRFEQAGLIPVDVDSGVELFLSGLANARHERLAAFNPSAAFASGRELSSHPMPARPRKRLLEEGSQDGRTIARFVKSRDLFLDQHLVKGDPVAPGTFVSEIFAEAAKDRKEVLCDINFRRPLWVRDEVFDVEVVERDGSLTLLPAERPELNEKGLANLAFATAKLRSFGSGEAEKLKHSKKDLEALLDAASDDEGSFYTLLDDRFSHALATGPIFRGIRATVERGGRYFGSVALTPEARATVASNGDFAFDPVLADMAVQVGCAWGMQKKSVMAIPFEIGCLRAHGEMTGTEAVVVCKARELGEDKAVLDVAVRDLDGTLVLTFDKLVLKTIARADEEK